MAQLPMAPGDDDTASPATVADRPAMLMPATLVSPIAEPGHGDRTVDAPPPAFEPPPRPPSVPPAAQTTAAEAMRSEEVDRTRQFIRMGWLISVVAMAGAPFLHAPRAMTIIFLAGLSLGILISVPFYRAFADPARYTEGALLFLALLCLVNSHIAVLYYGTFTVAPLIVVIGIHFVARTEAASAARWILATAITLYALCALPIITGAIEDPGVFASDRQLGVVVQLAGAGFVLGTYVLAHVTARTFRQASLRSIESLARATRLASQREALMDELRLDLERALRAGGPGRYTDHTVGNFKLGMVLGRGAMGEVYEAIELGSGAPAAVKLIRRDLSADRTHFARFLREVRASGALASPHVVKVLDASDRDPPYLAMERLHGTTLADRLRRIGEPATSLADPRGEPGPDLRKFGQLQQPSRGNPGAEPPDVRKDGKLGLAAVAELVRQVGAGLDAASAAGVIHRDIKPQNLFHDRVWKILDFGVATLIDESSGTLTQGGIVGTPSYMAPEQAQGKRLDGRADLYALAAVAYRCLTGRHPFSGADTPALLYAVVHKMPARPGELTDVVPDVDRWFALALAKQPADRFATGRELADALDAALAGALDGKLRKHADGLLRKLPWA